MEHAPNEQSKTNIIRWIARFALYLIGCVWDCLMEYTHNARTQSSECQIQQFRYNLITHYIVY